MARASGKLIALVAVFAAIGLVTATGAFTTVEATRTATVSVAGDSSALLQLDSTGGTGVAEFSNSEIEFNIDKINTDAYTDLGGVFTITNNGAESNTVDVYIIDDATDTLNANPQSLDDSNGNVTFYNVSSSSSIEGDSNAVSLGQGESVTVGIEIDLGDVTTGQNFLDGEIVIYAD